MFTFVSILIMWLMVFGVGLLYYGMLNEATHDHMIKVFVSSIFATILTWCTGGYFLAYGGPMITIFHPSADSYETLMDILFQLCFALYAIVMVIGSVIDRVSLKRILPIVILWILGVYVPLSHLIWSSQGLFYRLGVMDFAGGIVVHISAGVASLVMALLSKKSSFQHQETQTVWSYLGMILITFGWFGFNAGPVRELNEASLRIILNTLLAIIAGGTAWSLGSYLKDGSIQTSSLLNGMIVGLVTSTSSVGFVTALPIVILTFTASFLTYYANQWTARFSYEDVVDSFAMNGIGGLLGSIGTLFFYPDALLGQTLGILTAILLSASITFLSWKLLSRLGW